MRRRRTFRPKPKPQVRARINEAIRAEELRVIDQNGENLGVLSRADALAKAQEAKLDLVEIASETTPPVARIISFDKYRYQEEKKIKKQKAHAKTAGQKQVQISVRAQQHDLEVKARRVDSFLKEGNRVEVLMRLRGRENINKEFAYNKLNEFLTMINPDHTVLARGKGARGGITAVVGIKK